MTAPMDGAGAAAAALAAGQVSAVELTAAYQRRIEALDAAVGAWEHVDGVGARPEAAAAPPGPQPGVPVGGQDVLNTH